MPLERMREFERGRENQMLRDEEMKERQRPL